MSTSVIRYEEMEERNTITTHYRGKSTTIYRLNKVLDELLKKLTEIMLERSIKGIHSEYHYNYIILWKLLRDVSMELHSKSVVTTSNSYILPGALYIVKRLIDGSLGIDEAAKIIASIRQRVKKFMRILAFEKNLELLIPKNVEVKSVKVYAWSDFIGKDSDGNDQYVLTLYFSFPFDIHKFDGMSEYEPISFLFVRKGKKYIPVKAFARVHYDIYVYDIEKLDRIRVLFSRYGHTPIILDTRSTPLNPNTPKTLIDKLWLTAGSFITKLGGVKSIELKQLKENVHVFTSHKLEDSKVNPFTSKIHPYFISIELMH